MLSLGEREKQLGRADAGRDLGNNGAFDKGGCNMGMGPNQFSAVPK